jgi:hypothetical protein
VQIRSMPRAHSYLICVPRLAVAVGPPNAAAVMVRVRSATSWSQAVAGYSAGMPVCARNAVMAAAALARIA